MKSGYIAVIGRANAGKSTLVNVLVGEKVSIVSPKPQTTRDRILGVLTTKDYQMVFVDTPGLYRADSLLNSLMQRTAENSVSDVDIIVFVIDAHAGISENDVSLMEKFKKAGLPFVLVLSKIDIMPETLLISELKSLAEKDVEVVPVSARKGKNIKELLSVLESKLVYDGKIFEEEIVSDRSEKFMISEIMREKILLKFDKEIPHGVAIVINEFTLKGKTYHVNLDIVCEKQNHKAILIGKNGTAIKQVSTMAREEMEKFLGRKVFLTVFVKVKENWRNSASLMNEYGYKEE